MTGGWHRDPPTTDGRERRTARWRRPDAPCWPPPSLRGQTSRRRKRSTRAKADKASLAARPNHDGTEGARCAYCLVEQPLTQLTRDHIIPSSRGGTNAADNLVLACTACNSAKGSRTPQEWRPGHTWAIDRLNLQPTPEETHP